MKLLRVALGCLVLLAVFVGPSAAADTNLMVDVIYHATGYLLVLAGLGLRMWAILYVGSKKSRQLTTTGPYSICRNPLYVGTVLLTLGVSLGLENLVMCMFALAVVVPLHIAIVLAEEKHLRGIFGQEYVQYTQCTPRFWFRLSAYRSDSEVSVPVKALRRAILDAVGVLMIPPLTLFVDTLRQHNMLPVLWRGP